MRNLVIIGCLLICGVALAAGQPERHALGEPRALNLTRADSLDYEVSERLIRPESLNRLDLHRGRVRLAHAKDLDLSFARQLRSFALNLEDPNQDSVFELRWYRDQYLLGSQRFAPAGLQLPDAIVIFNGHIAIESEVPFDRIVLKEIHGRSGVDVEYVSGVQALVASAEGSADTNLAAFACQIPLGLAYNVAFAAGLLAVDPVSAAIADSAAYSSNLGLKFCKTVLEAPPDLTGRVSDGSCFKSLEQPHLVAEYENALGFPLKFEYDWGDLGTPLVHHHNTEVEVGAYFDTQVPPSSGSLDLKLLIEDRALTTDATDLIYQECRSDGSVATSQLDGQGRVYACPYTSGRMIDFPVGRNTVLWRANTKMGPLDLIPLSVPGTPATAKNSPYKGFLENLLKEILVIGADTYLFNGWRWGNVHDEHQVVTVYDEVLPVITPTPTDQPRITTSLVGDEIHVQIEADEPGGVSRHNYERILSHMYAVTDACDRDVSFHAEYPDVALRTFWPVSTQSQDNSFAITWRASDPGPNLADLPNEATTTMLVEVVDIRPPTIVPPPDIVEVTTGQVSELGQPLVFDFVDLQPLISNDASLPLGSGLHQVTWTVTDASGNSDQALQLVNVKTSNLDPFAVGQTGTLRNHAVSFEPTTLRLWGDDPDGDPLRFYIEQYPDNGFFVAPLYPYFVEDYRLEQSASAPELTDACYGTSPGTAPDFDLTFPSEPSYMAVNDAGTTFVVDRGWIDCSALQDDGFRRMQRVVKFDSDGGLVSSIRIPEDTLRDVIVDQRNELIFVTSTSGSGSSFIRVLDFDLVEVETYRLTNMRDRGTNTCSTPHSCEILNARSALVDDAGILYVMDVDGLIFALIKGEGNMTLFVDYVTDDVTGGGSRVPADQLAMDSVGNLYASRNNRIYKYSRSFFGTDGLAYPGSPLGWMGRCDTDLAPGDEAVCDITNHRSMGYSCTDAICGITDEATEVEKALCGWVFSNKGNFGCRPGHFYGPRGIDFDLRDNLYVADAGNQRIQRFTPEGFFAGVAESACDGSCFVLGDFGRPQDVSVNSDHVYILDPDTNLLHVSQLTPFTDIGPDWAELVYQSNNDFACTNSTDCIDVFGFRVSDGVRDAVTGLPMRTAPATVEVEVSRNFRPPVATPGIASVAIEDVLTPIILDGSEQDPLDSLSFNLTDPPAHGTVIIVGNEARYLSSPDYVGGDSFRFAAFDGFTESAPEIVSVTVLNENDAPRVSDLDDATVGVGFSFQVAHDFDDPDVGEVHLLSVDWGDGTIEPEGEIDGTGNATGPLLDEIGTGQGRITADHVYTGTGTRILEICVYDQVDDTSGIKVLTPDSLVDCAQAVINIIDALDLVLAVTPSVEIALPGQIVGYDFEVTNLTPEAAGSGLTATGVQFVVDLSPYLDETSISIIGSGCTRNRYQVTCNFDTLAVGATAVLQVTAQLPFSIDPGVMLQTRAKATLNETDQTPENSLQQVIPVVRPGDYYVGTTSDALRDKPDTDTTDGICASEDEVCTLRAAVEQAEATPGLNVITLGNGVYRLEGSGLPTIYDDLVMLGNGPDRTIIDAADLGGVLRVAGAGSLQIEDLALANASGPALSAYAPAIVRRVRFTSNYAKSYFGGGILNASHLELRDVTFDGNRSDNDGGAVWNGGGSSSTMVNVTAVGNINSAFAFTDGNHSLTNVTIVGNTGGAGWEAPAAALNVYGSNTTVTLVNTALIGNRIGPVGGAKNCVAFSGSQLISQGNNLFGDLAGCNISLQASDQVADNALLLPTTDNGGGLPTMKPRIDSMLVDMGAAGACPDADARGVPRPEDGNEDGNSQCDIGAFELQRNSLFSSGFESP